MNYWKRKFYLTFRLIARASRMVNPDFGVQADDVLVPAKAELKEKLQVAGTLCTIIFQGYIL